MRPLVLLHGFTGGQRSFEEVTRRLVPDRPVHTPFLPGHGPRPAVLPTDWRHGIELVLASLADVEAPFDLCGYSLGGRTALGLLARVPERIASLVLVGAHPGLRSDEERAARRTADAEHVARLRRDGLERFVDAWESQPLFATQDRVPEASRRAKREDRLGHTADGLAASLEAMGLGAMPDARPALAAYEGAVDVVVGALDAKFRPIAEEVARCARRATLHVVPGAGHDVPLEAPAALAAILSSRPDRAAPETADP